MLSTIRAIVRRANTLAETYAAAQAEGTMTAVVKIIRRDDSTDLGWDSATSTLVMDEPEVIWGPELPGGGIGKVSSVTGPVTMALGDEPQYFQSTFASIPKWAAQPEVDDILTVIAHDDPKLVGRSYRVVDVERGGQIPVAHRMQVVGIQPGRTWRQP